MGMLNCMLFLLMTLSLTTVSEATIVVTCTTTSMTITESYDDFGTSSHNFYVTPDSASCPSSTLTGATDDNTILITYATHPNCLQGTGGGAVGYRGVSYVLNYASKGFVTSTDKSGYATCEYSDTTDTGTGTFTDTSSTITQNTIDFGTTLGLEFYSKPTTGTTLSPLSSTSINLSADIYVCATAYTDDAATADISIKSLSFASAASGGSEDEYITNHCTNPSFSLSSLMQTPTKDFGATRGDGTCTDDMNCKKQRSFCFTPFLYTDTTTLYFKATIVPLTGASSDYESCSSGGTGIGRKRRDLDAISGEEVTKTVAVPISMYKQENPKEICAQQMYFQILVGFACAFLFSTIIAVFTVYVTCKKKNKIDEMN